MDDISHQNESIELLQQLGLKEYEAKAFVALARLPHGTAKEISEVSEVPRTRVYDAIRVLETKGLVEIQHSSPQQFRSVSIDEAVDTLRDEYEERIGSLRSALAGVDQAAIESDSDVSHEVWSLSGRTAITNRTQGIVESATDEVVVVFGAEDVYTDEIGRHLRNATERGAEVIVGTFTEALRDRVRDAVPDAEVFVSGLDWLEGLKAVDSDDDTEISRLLLVDRSTILVGTQTATTVGDDVEERAVFGRGFDNGLVVIARRLMSSGLGPSQDPSVDAD